MVTKQEMTAAMQEYCRCQCEKDKAGWLALFAPEVVHEDPVGSTNVNTGHDMLGAFWDTFSPWDLKTELAGDLIVCGNEAIVPMRAESGPAGQRHRTEPIIDVVTFNDAGKITSVRAFYEHG